MQHELYHHGIRNQRWGQRRFQNKDGSLTAAGKIRYGKNTAPSAPTENKSQASNTSAKKSDAEMQEYIKRRNLEKQYSRLKNEDSIKSKMDKLNQRTSASSHQLESLSREIAKPTKVKRVDLSRMTDAELREKINRHNLERQYIQAYNPPEISKGRQYVSDLLKGASVGMSATASALTIALMLKDLHG